MARKQIDLHAVAARPQSQRTVSECNHKEDGQRGLAFDALMPTSSTPGLEARDILLGTHAAAVSAG